jgi:hypothetical protein
MPSESLEANLVDDEERALMAEYKRLAHAMQSGVALMLERCDEASPKHLRVGVNSALVDSGTIAELLVERGIFTRKEFLRKLVETMRREVEDYQERIKNAFGGNPDLQIHLE